MHCQAMHMGCMALGDYLSCCCANYADLTMCMVALSEHSPRFSSGQQCTSSVKYDGSHFALLPAYKPHAVRSNEFYIHFPDR